MDKVGLAKEASKRMVIATELMHQLWALQSFEAQRLISTCEVHDGSVRIIREFVEETEKAIDLINKFVEVVSDEGGK